MDGYYSEDERFIKLDIGYREGTYDITVVIKANALLGVAEQTLKFSGTYPADTNFRYFNIPNPVKNDFILNFGTRILELSASGKDGKYDLNRSWSFQITDDEQFRTVHVGTAGDDRHDHSGFKSTFDGLAGNDVMVMYPGSRFDGGDGRDTAIIAAPFAGAWGADLGMKVYDNGIDPLIYFSNVERFQFLDKTLAFDEGAGQVYRLYQAAFSRTPDKGGLSYWVEKMDHGLSLRDIVYGFINSVEFQKAYGNSLTNAELVVQLYTNILGRAPEKAGADYWIGELDRGTSRLDVFASISESGENRDKLKAVIGQGIDLDTAVWGLEWTLI